jgi:hypothetical protein
MRCTLETDNPLSFAMPRELQCVAFLGRLSRVLTITAAILNRPRRTGPGLIAQAIHAVLDKAPAPFAHGCFNHPELRRHLFVLPAFRAGQNDASPESQCLGRLAAARQCPQLTPLFVAHN